MKLTILGGGGFRTPFIWQALIRDQGEPRVDELALYDTSQSRMDTMVNIMRVQAQGFDHKPGIRTYTELEPALSGADFIFAAIREGGLQARCCDEHVALDLGLLGQETTGPGGLAYAMRTVPVMLRMARMAARVCPDAYFLNFTNPAGIITEALQSVLGDRVVGICDTPSGLGRRIAAALGHDPEDVSMDYVGLNHLGWMRRVLVGDHDLLPDLLADEEKLSGLEEAKVFDPDWLRQLGMIPNEYLFYYYCDRDAVRRILESPMTRGDFLLKTQTRFYKQAATAGNEADRIWTDALQERGASYMAEALGGVQGAPTSNRKEEFDPAHLGYAGVALGVMNAISRHERRVMILNVRNRGTIASLPNDAVVEVPSLVDSHGIHPLNVGEQPTMDQIGLMQQVRQSERHAVRAGIEGSSHEALLAFALHPLVQSVPLARKLLAGYRREIPEMNAIFEKRG